MIRRVLPFLAAALPIGCAQPGGDRFPSLAPRAAERGGFEEPAAAPPAVARPDPALDARIAAALAEAAPATDPATAARRTATSKVAAAAGTPAGSPAWLDAQVALGELDVLRAGASAAVGALEQLATDRAVAGEVPYPALDTAITELRGRLAEATAADARLAARLSR